MTYRVVNNRTGMAFVGDDLHSALHVVLADHTPDDDINVAIDSLADATMRGDRLFRDVWADALGVTITPVVPSQRQH